MCILINWCFKRMIQHRSMSQCAVPTQCVSSIMVNVYIIHVKLMCKMCFYTILRLYFHHKNVSQFHIHFDRWILSPIKSKVSSPLKIAKLFQFYNSVFPTIFSGCNAHYYNGWNWNTNSLGNALWQALIHPLWYS